MLAPSAPVTMACHWSCEDRTRNEKIIKSTPCTPSREPARDLGIGQPGNTATAVTIEGAESLIGFPQRAPASLVEITKLSSFRGETILKRSSKAGGKPDQGSLSKSFVNHCHLNKMIWRNLGNGRRWEMVRKLLSRLGFLTMDQTWTLYANLIDIFARIW